jgi:hypothetical protein
MFSNLLETKHFRTLLPFWRGATLPAPLLGATIVHLLFCFTRQAVGLEARLSGM